MPLVQPIPVYIAYFTAAATTDGNIVTYADIYGRDAPVRQALNTRRARHRGGLGQLTGRRPASEQRPSILVLRLSLQPEE